ncbi:MAG: MerR family transcriptional regulator [Candidatus Aphodomorpha sp.]
MLRLKVNGHDDQNGLRAQRFDEKGGGLLGAAGLMHPAVSEYGYRSFSEEDVQQLLHIGVLRALGRSIPTIDRALRGEADAVLHTAGQNRFGTKPSR